MRHRPYDVPDATLGRDAAPEDTDDSSSDFVTWDPLYGTFVFVEAFTPTP